MIPVIRGDVTSREGAKGAKIFINVITRITLILDMIGWYGRTVRASLIRRAFSWEIPID